MKSLDQRYSEAIKKIGGAPGLQSLPKQIKEVLKGKYDLKTKTEMLEMIAEAMKK